MAGGGQKYGGGQPQQQGGKYGGGMPQAQAAAAPGVMPPPPATTPTGVGPNIAADRMAAYNQKMAGGRPPMMGGYGRPGQGFQPNIGGAKPAALMMPQASMFTDASGNATMTPPPIPGMPGEPGLPGEPDPARVAQMQSMQQMNAMRGTESLGRGIGGIGKGRGGMPQRQASFGGMGGGGYGGGIGSLMGRGGYAAGGPIKWTPEAVPAGGGGSMFTNAAVPAITAAPVYKAPVAAPVVQAAAPAAPTPVKMTPVMSFLSAMGMRFDPMTGKVLGGREMGASRFSHASHRRGGGR